MENEELKGIVAEYNQMLSDGKVLEAFVRFYGDDVVMQENTDEPMVGKEANHAREEGMWSKITEIREIKPMEIAFGENGVVMGLWHYDMTHAEWGVYESTQVSVQWWKDGKIVKEQFFHK